MSMSETRTVTAKIMLLESLDDGWHVQVEAPGIGKYLHVYKVPDEDGSRLEKNLAYKINLIRGLLKTGPGGVSKEDKDWNYAWHWGGLIGQPPSSDQEAFDDTADDEEPQAPDNEPAAPPQAARRKPAAQQAAEEAPPKAKPAVPTEPTAMAEHPTKMAGFRRAAATDLAKWYIETQVSSDADRGFYEAEVLGLIALFYKGFQDIEDGIA